MTPKIIVHGDARSSEANEAERQKDVMAACEAGHDVLLEQGSIDAVEHAIKRLEESQFLDAGVGSYLQLDGRVRMDASIMKGDSSAGAGLAVHTIHRS